MTEHTVYIYRDTSRRTLYVGITGRGHQRAEEHAVTKEWWPQVDSASFIHVASREAALDLERVLIELLAPEGNVQHYQEPEDGLTPILTHGQFQSLTRGQHVIIQRAHIRRGIAIPEMSDATWMALPTDLKYTVGCLSCGKDREREWRGPRCPECRRAA